MQLEALLVSPTLCSSHPLPATFLAASLVARGTLGLRALQGPRNLLLNGSLAGQAWEEEAAALFLGRAVASLPLPQQQQQWLLEVLDATKVGLAAVHIFLCSLLNPHKLMVYVCACIHS